MKDLLEMGKELFFPNGKSSKGPIEEFEFDIRDFSHNKVPLEFTVNNLYEKTKLKMLRIYIASKKMLPVQMKKCNRPNPACLLKIVISGPQCYPAKSLLVCDTINVPGGYDEISRSSAGHF
ncbi:hypothetical protein WMY93_012781 [Mugilogobius chulae]|uniref:Uncharacterized protein n=1 Tax=Mugilogobius chulae TaxID=88201 RepID=A0AAW0P793_9GOBI